MSLLNYTTKMPVETTLLKIQKQLVAHGAIAVMNEFDDHGYITALTFSIKVNDRTVGFKLPSDWRPVLQILENDKKVPRRLVCQEQALKVAWRIIKDWVEAQMAIVETKMVTTDQVFLPYAITNDGKTIYEQIKDSNFMLSDGKQKGDK